ncbi:DUF2142 domain-containing protein [Oerskovia enterophila]|uniref:DUF2142 domain-containing protein n=1 Tax=Oerskovia enterophila TaxID=43678 RepID=UPI0033972EFF
MATEEPQTTGSEPATGRAARRPRRAVRAGVMLLALFTFLLTWAFASPLGATPDENYHMASIWCAEGERDGACLTNGDGTVFAVPEALPMRVCYAFDPERAATCQPEVELVGTDRYVVTKVGNFGEHAGDYPGLFYSVMSQFVGPDVQRSILVMRVLNAAIFTLLVGVVYAFSSVRVRRALVATTAVTLVPLGAFLIPSINPSGWTIGSASILFFALYGAVQSRSRTTIAVLASTAVLAFTMSVGSRADGAVYAGLAVVVATMLGLRSLRPTWRNLLRLVLPAVMLGVALRVFLSVGSSAVQAPQEGSSGSWPVVQIFLDVFQYIPGSLGWFALGWGDTTMPTIVWVLVGTACAGVVFVGLAHLGRRRLVATLVAVGALLAVPTYIAATSWVAGAALQARYIFPMVIIAVAVLTLVTEARGPAATTSRGLTLTVPQRWFVVGAISVAGAVAIYINLRRYVTGVDVQKLRLTPAEWWWPGAPVSPEVLCIISAAALVTLLVLATRVLVPGAADVAGGPAGSDELGGSRSVASGAAPVAPVSEAPLKALEATVPRHARAAPQN